MVGKGDETAMNHCIFCRIAAHEAPAYILCEDETSLAFMDINPASPGHVLVVSRQHAVNIFDVSPPALAGVMKTVQRVATAVNAAFLPDGLSIVQANGPGAAQSVLHFHVHVLPRSFEDGLPINWQLRPGERHAIEAAADRIRAAL